MTTTNAATAPVDEIAARRLERLDVEVRELLELGWWWILEDNPPCMSWCTTDHAPDEFRKHGALDCSHVVAETTTYRVEARHYRFAEEGAPGRLTSSPPSVSVLSKDLDLEPEDVPRFSAALAAAAAVIADQTTHPDLSEWASWMRRHGLSENTIEQRVSFVRGRVEEWGGWDATGEELAVWLGRYAGWTQRTYQNHVSSLYRWLVETGQRRDSPIRDLRPARTPAPKPRPLRPDQVELVLRDAEGDLRSWLELALFAGLRAHEIAKIRGEDITSETVYVLGKGNQVGKIPTHPRLWEIAQRYPAGGFWFPSTHRRRPHLSAGRISQAVHRHFGSVGVDGSIHRLRATFGTELLRSGVNLRVIQDLMRHRSLVSTEHYLGVTDEERAAAVRTLDRFWSGG